MEERETDPCIDNLRWECYAPSENAFCMTTKPVNEYKFGPFQANTDDLELRKSGVRIKLQPKPFQVLKVLLERAGRSVSREELKALLWAPDIFVDFDHGLNTAVNKIREALSDSAEQPRYIETLANGYKFIGEINEQPGGRP